ncbi:hypothetical protein [Planctomicrobium sp. SH664]|uniref:hypothetical protein n=1 Tax=Planctomicrobium sp. SH664 TaxID=3448125 RepID=UPI003F5C92C0
MTILLTKRFCILLLLAGIVGCAPSSKKTPTRVVSERDVKITVGPPTKPKPPEKEKPVADAEKATAKATPKTDDGGQAAGTAAAGKDVPTAAPAAAPSAATVTKGSGPARFKGKVVVKGTPPKIAPLISQGQAGIKDEVCTRHEIPSQVAVVGPEGGLKNVFVYLKKAPRGAVSSAVESHAELDQHGCVYEPHAQIMRTGSTIRLKNSDSVAHNVHITGRAASFNQTVKAGDKEGLEFTFAVPEALPAKVSCDFHAWMTAWILPVDHNWAALTNEQGEFEIADLPEGDLEFIVWQEKLGYVERSFKVHAEAGHVVEKIFEVDASKLAQ